MDMRHELEVEYDIRFERMNSKELVFILTFDEPCKLSGHYLTYLCFKFLNFVICDVPSKVVQHYSEELNESGDEEYHVTIQMPTN